jgi:hypothetical protein
MWYDGSVKKTAGGRYSIYWPGYRRKGRGPNCRERKSIYGGRGRWGKEVYDELPEPFRSAQMQGAPEDETGGVHGRTLRMAAEEQRRRWALINGSVESG